MMGGYHVVMSTTATTGVNGAMAAIVKTFSLLVRKV